MTWLGIAIAVLLYLTVFLAGWLCHGLMHTGRAALSAIATYHPWPGAPTPPAADEPCPLCSTPPRDGPMSRDEIHPECGLRMVLGGWGHHVDHEHWCIEVGDPDGGLSYRESAIRVAARYSGGPPK